MGGFLYSHVWFGIIMGNGVTLMKGWQIIVSGFLPYVVGMSGLLAILKSNHPDYFTLGTMLYTMLGGLPLYFFTVLPWYIPVYWARRSIGVKAFYGAGFVILLLQCVACSFILGATLGDAQLWLLVLPVLGPAISVFMICIKVFYKQRSELVEIND